jgi:hypothetical protein
MTLSYSAILNWAVWLVVGLIGLTRIPFPFEGDQALFTIGAEQMSRGAVLYRDFWDLKQPGIYGFYELAGRLFGFSEVGIHTLEWVYMMALAIVLRFALKRYYTMSMAINLLPLLTVGVYYAACRSWHLTQVEALVSFPLFLCFWFAYCAFDHDRAPLLLFLSGVMGGLVLLFKFALLPILLVVWLVNFNFKVRNIVRVAYRTILPIFLGVMVCLLPVILYFNYFDSLDLLYKTWFDYPRQILTQIPDAAIAAEIGSPWRRLGNGLVWFVPWVSPLIALGVLGLYFSPQSYRNRLTLSCVAWIITGFLVIWIQQTSLWAYHYSLLFVPFGILAAKGLDICWERQSRLVNGSVRAFTKQVILSVTVGFLLLPAFIPTFKDTLLLAIGRLGLTEAERFEYQHEINPAYETVRAETAFLAQPDSLPGRIYVFGDPLMYFLSGRTQAIAINGWSLEYLLPEQWQQMVKQFAAALPPYIFVVRTYEDIIAQRGNLVHQFIQERYRPLRQGQTGIWYVLNR